MFLYDDKEFVGKKIKQLRTNVGLSQAELSEKIGMTEKNLSNIERGLQYPALNSFLKLLDILNVSVSEFGVNIINNSITPEKEQILKEIFLASNTELDAYSQIIKIIKNINK